MTNTERTAGQALAAELRSMLSIGPRTRTYRSGVPVTHDAIVERVQTSLAYRGYDDERRTAIFETAFNACWAYQKHVAGFRIDPTLRMEIMSMSPWKFTAFLGEMVDSGHANMGEFETWFRARAHR
jgi:hypothetical protein